MCRRIEEVGPTVGLPRHRHYVGFSNVSVLAPTRDQIFLYRRYKYLVLGHEETYFVKEHSDSKHKYSKDDIIKMLEFLVDNIFVVFAGKVFQQTVGIPMGTNCAPLLADIFLYSYEADFIQSLLSTGKIH